ncbi:TPA: hypothetical protein ACPDW7_001854 [Pasteurella multocida]|uniref:hypothetical protein n=1 Tax=Pasteurella multocida TaxID=747 RepID=UPI0033001027|nr:hypothetical protein [Pasteurella multocida]HDR1432927.1 hypothetical protein [Pasteurella multocida]HDR1790150.1 hypothetical protein [Pasteurella multocida]HDR1830180.1 hypothetical protein [Pasteurella multocida]HDR1857138.1 hypothetical protein [Pasteurella multocida]
MSELIVSVLALIISIIGIPIGYYLGSRTAKNNECNKEIDALEELTETILRECLNTYSSEKTDTGLMSYHLMVAYHKKLQMKCTNIKDYGSFDDYPRELLRKIKQNITDKLFCNDEKASAIATIVILLSSLNDFYKKKFW